MHAVHRAFQPRLVEGHASVAALLGDPQCFTAGGGIQGGVGGWGGGRGDGVVGVHAFSMHGAVPSRRRGRAVRQPDRRRDWWAGPACAGIRRQRLTSVATGLASRRRSGIRRGVLLRRGVVTVHRAWRKRGADGHNIVGSWWIVNRRCSAFLSQGRRPRRHEHPVQTALSNANASRYHLMDHRAVMHSQPDGRTARARAHRVVQLLIGCGVQCLHVLSYPVCPPSFPPRCSAPWQ